MIIVTGATGQLGAQIVDELLTRVPAEQVGVTVRDPRRAEHLAAHGVTVRRADFAEAQTLTEAFDGAAQVLVVSVATLGPDGVAQNTRAIDAAYRAGAERVLYTSHQAADPGTSFPPGRDHAAVEAHLRELGRPFTSLRNGYYASSLLFHLGDAAETGELATPADGPVSWTTRADLAAAAAAVLAADGSFDGPTPPLTASAALDLEQVAAQLSGIVGRTVRRVVLEDEDWIARQVDRGAPEPMARMFLGTYVAARNGEFAVTDPTLTTLIGREPQPVRTVLETVHADAERP